MDSRDFISLVEKMRAAQKEYFSTREQAALKRCVKLESDVDFALADMKREQYGLFDVPQGRRK